MNRCLCFAVLSCLGFCSLAGCGNGSVPPAAPSASPATAAAPISDSAAAASDAAVTSANADAPETTTSTAMATAPDPANANATDRENASNNSPAGSPVTAAPAPTPIAAYQPTAAQLDQWMQPDYTPLQLLACRDHEQASLLTGMIVLPDGKQYLTAGSKLTLWSIDSDSPVQTLADWPQDTYITSIALSPNGKWFVVGDSEGNVQVWSTADKKVVSKQPLHDSRVVQVVVAPNGQQIATIGHDNTVFIWKASDLSAISKIEVDTNGLKRIAYVSNDELAAAGETTSLYDVASGKVKRQLSPGRYNATLQSSLNHDRLIYGENDTLRLIDPASDQMLTIAGPFATDELVALTDANSLLATANGATLRVWSLAAPQPLQVFDVIGFPIVSLQWFPGSSLLAVASQNGRVRLYGTAESGKPLSLEPIMAAVPPYTADSKLPPTPAQLLAAIDLRTFPRPPGTKAQLIDAKQLMLSGPVSQEEATQFYQYTLAKAGWTEVASTTSLPGNHEFQKGHHALNLMVQPTGAEVSITLSHVGRLDLSQLPRVDGNVQMIVANENTTMYRVQQPIHEIEVALLRKLQAAGWCPYSRLNTSHSESEERRDLLFLRGSAELLASIAPAPGDAGSFMVQYSRLTTMNPIPVPSDASYVEFDGSTEPRLVAFSRLGLDELVKQYQQSLAAQGWLERDIKQDEAGDNVWMSFVHNQQDLTIGLSKHESGATLVRAGDDVDRSSWQLSQQAKAESTDTESTEEAAGIEAADFPILSDNKQAKWDAVEQTIEVPMGKRSLIEAGEIYEKALNQLGWESDGSGIRDNDYVMLSFEKGGKELTVRGRLSDGDATLNVQGDGLLWTKPLPGGAKITSFETWLRNRKQPASLDALQPYLAEMSVIMAGKK